MPGCNPVAAFAAVTVESTDPLYALFSSGWFRMLAAFATN
jgi:hypothetical protein